MASAMVGMMEAMPASSPPPVEGDFNSVRWSGNGGSSQSSQVASGKESIGRFAWPPRTPPLAPRHLPVGSGAHGVQGKARPKALSWPMAGLPSPADSSLPRPAGARGRLRRAAMILAHVCGSTQCKKSSRTARQHLSASFVRATYTPPHQFISTLAGFPARFLYQSKEFGKLKTLLFVQPKQRSQENLRELQLCLKNRSFHSLPNEVQLQLCQTTIYQECGGPSFLTVVETKWFWDLPSIFIKVIPQKYSDFYICQVGAVVAIY
ncbi:uncharacterized protein LOC114236131 [Balaenoptera acutorostrata]|uniref:Uncharacterized protein LOC114236131 n=1 Tax=Balaenoptera acutorostrata TaxID=9767 RepID=A0ABM3TJL1_BALAC|nr:uncharacterized protein LOC114236131 [Balaenoptera acutorostrata]